MRTTPIEIVVHGSVIAEDHGYLVIGGEDAVCFFVDTDGADWIGCTDRNGVPALDLSKDDDYRPTTIEFAEFKNSRIHSVTAGKTVSVALVREAALDEVISSTTGIKFWR